LFRLNKKNSSSNISQHVTKYHSDLVAELDPKLDGKPPAQQNMLQFALYSGVQLEECHRAVAQFCVREGGRPLDLVRKEPFKVMAQKLSGKRYPGVSPDTIRRHINEMDEQLRGYIIADDLEAMVPGSMTIIFDGWSSE
jgi:hypothetical protein